jgi:hypothetical protein
MRERPTPETDAVAAHEGNWDTKALRMTVHACKLERERDEAQKELSSIHRWIDKNHADGFIDSLTYLQNLERVVDNWYDRIDAIEADARRFVRERDEARGLLRIAVGLLSTQPQFADKHPEDVLAFVKEGAK